MSVRTEGTAAAAAAVHCSCNYNSDHHTRQHTAKDRISRSSLQPAGSLSPLAGAARMDIGVGPRNTPFLPPLSRFCRRSDAGLKQFDVDQCCFLGAPSLADTCCSAVALCPRRWSSVPLPLPSPQCHCPQCCCPQPAACFPQLYRALPRSIVLVCSRLRVVDLPLSCTTLHSRAVRRGGGRCAPVS